MTTLPFAEQDGHTVIQLPVNLDQNDWLGFRDLIHRQFVNQGMVHLVFDCEQCSDLPSIAFGTFACLSRDLHRAGGSLHLVHVSEKIRQVLTKTRMTDSIPIRGTLTEVIHRPKDQPTA